MVLNFKTLRRLISIASRLIASSPFSALTLAALKCFSGPMMLSFRLSRSGTDASLHCKRPSQSFHTRLGTGHVFFFFDPVDRSPRV